MLYRPINNLQNNNFIENLPSGHLDGTSQHGIYHHQQNEHQHLFRDKHPRDAFSKGQERKPERRILLDVPPETLTSITSYLTPPALLSLGCVSSYLAHHVREDNTWRRAFLCHFLRVSPEADINVGPCRSDGSIQLATGYHSRSWKTLLLRRVEGRSWRDEFTWRYVMINRWSRSKSSTMTHTPVIHSNISGLHLMSIPSPANASSQALSSIIARNSTTSTAGTVSTPYIYPSTRFAAPALLSASNQYGIVARSLPLTGKVLTGYLDASAGARLGVPAFGAGNLNFAMGNLNGNPNAQFTPNVTVSDITSSIPPLTQGEISSSGHPHLTLGTAHIAWGTSAGDLIFTTAPHTMNVNVNDGSRAGGGRNGGRSGVEVRRCQFGDEHEGAVRDVKWVECGSPDKAGRWVLSGGSDGRVKLWDATRAMCLWSSEVMRDRERLGTVPDPCVRVDSFFPSLRSKTSEHSEHSPNFGVVVAVGESGDIYVWFGLDIHPAYGRGGGEDIFDASAMTIITIDCPFKPSTFYLDASASNGPGPERHSSSVCKVSALSIDSYTNFFPEEEDFGPRFRFLVAYDNDPLFYRVTLQIHLGKYDNVVDVTPFGNPNFGPTSVVKPFFGLGFGGGGVEANVGCVLVGDHIGCVSLYDWDAPSSSTSPTTAPEIANYHAREQRAYHHLHHQLPISPLRTFEAHRDGANVTALWWDGLVLVTGSSRGTTHVWDGVTLEHLRSFVSPVKRTRGRDQHQNHHLGGNQMVRHILVNMEKDVLVVCVGDTIMAWHAGVLGRAGKGKDARGGGGVRGRHMPGTGPSPGKRRATGAKFVGEYEMRRTILESQDLLASEDKETRKKYAREREHRQRLDALGLSEGEALEYALMLSRDESEARALALAVDAEAGVEDIVQEEGVFEGDFSNEEEAYEDASVYGVSPSVSSASESSLASSMQLSLYLGSSEDVGEDDAFPPIPGSGNASPDRAGGRLIEEGSQAEETARAKGQIKGKGKEKASRKGRPTSVSTTKSGSTEGSANISAWIPVTNTANAIARSPAAPNTPGGSPTSLKKTNAWSVPLKTKPSSSPSTWGSSSSSPVTGLSSHSPASAGSSPFSGFARGVQEDDMDEDLRFALQLSLVEARSRGENV